MQKVVSMNFVVKIEKIKDFDFFPELKDDLWDVKYYHH